MMREDPLLTARIRARDPVVLQQLLREHLGMLVRVGRSWGMPPDFVDDVVQETMLTFIARAADFDGRSRVRTWLYGIMRKKAASLRRTADRELETDAIDQVVDARFTSLGRWGRGPRAPDARADADRVRAWVGQCLSGLTERRRHAFVLAEVDDLTTDEICRVLDITPGNLGVLLFRARNGLRECLEARGIRGRHDADV
ncbi:MAG: sigma-70 family RNA polymerase sigma factor [Gemmatimonadales bacterium]